MSITPTGALMHQAHTRPTSVAFVFHERRVDELPRNALSRVDRNMLQTMAAGTDKARQIEAAASQPKPPNERPTRRVARNR